MKRVLLIILAALVVLIALPLIAVLIFLNSPGWQRSVVLGQLNGQPGMHAEAAYIKAGLGGAKVDDLFVLSYDTGIFIDEATVEYNVWAILGKTVEVALVDVQGVKLAPGIESSARLKQLFPQVEGTYQPQPAPVTTPEPQEPGEPMDFDGILAMTRDLGLKFDLEKISADAQVVLPDGTELNAQVSGGNIAPGAEGRITVEAQGRLAQAINGYSRVNQQLQLRLAQLAEGGFSRIDLQQTTRMEGDTATPVALLVDGELKAVEGGEAYTLNLRSDTSPQPLVDLNARWTAASEQLEGTLAMDLDTQETEVLAALLQPHRFVWQGQADFAVQVETLQGSLTADFQGNAHVAQAEGLPLRQDLDLDLALVAQADYTGQALRAPQLKLSVTQQGGGRLLNVQNLQPIELDEHFQSAAQGELIEIALQLPRELWRQLQIEGAVQPQAVVANLRVAQEDDALVLRAPQPLQATAQLTAEGQPARTLEARFSPQARITPTGGSAGWTDLRVTFDQSEILSSQLSADWQTPADAPLSAKTRLTYTGQLPQAVAEAFLGAEARRLPRGIRSQGEVAADYDPENLTVQKLNVALAAENRDLLVLQAPKALRLKPTDADFGLSQLQGELITLRLNDIPLTLANAFLGGATVSGTAAGTLGISASDERVTLRASQPLTLKQLSYTDPEQGALVQGIDGTLDLQAMVSPENFAFELKTFRLTSAAGELASGTMKAEGALTADPDSEVKLSGNFNASLANLLRQPIAKKAPQPIRSTTAQVNFSAQAKPTAGTGTFDAKVQAGTLVIDELMALAPQGGSTQGQPAPQQPAPNQPQPTGEEPSREPDAKPLWAGYTGKAALQIAEIIQGKATIADVAGELRVEPGQVVIDMGAKQAETPLSLNGRLAFNEQQPQSPYQLSGKLDVQNFDPGPFLTTPQGQTAPVLEGTFNLAGQLNGSAPNLAVIAEAVAGQFKVTSENGVIRPLGEWDQRGTMLASGLGALSGIVGGDAARIAKESQAVLNEVLEGLREVRYDSFALDLERDDSLDLFLRNLDIQSSTVHLVGQGAIDYLNQKPATDWTTNIKMSLRGAGPLIDNLEKLGWEFPNTDSEGYTAIESFELSGPLGNLQSSLVTKIVDHAKKELLDEGGNFLRGLLPQGQQSGTQQPADANAEGTAEGQAQTSREETVARGLGGFLQGLQNRQQQKEQEKEKQTQQQGSGQ
ncbi:MAG: hypothetical protein Q7P63_10615 [Verrucomicrobiota bacterium JB022]|nr:hypothetical protein [Verrucomicrobiota bacterium JB022]